MKPIGRRGFVFGLHEFLRRSASSKHYAFDCGRSIVLLCVWLQKQTKSIRRDNCAADHLLAQAEVNNADKPVLENNAGYQNGEAQHTRRSNVSEGPGVSSFGYHQSSETPRRR